MRESLRPSAVLRNQICDFIYLHDYMIWMHAYIHTVIIKKKRYITEKEIWTHKRKNL